MNNNANETHRGMMRDVSVITVSERRQELLRKVFPSLTGIVGAVSTDTMAKSDAVSLALELCEIIPGINDSLENCELRSKLGIQTTCMSYLIMNKNHGDSGHSRKVTRILSQLISEMGIKMEEDPDIRSRYNKWLAQYSACFTGNPMEYTISDTIQSFDSLGHIQDVDSNGRSCYCDTGCWMDAPITLAAGFGRDITTFTVLLGNNGIPEARCWGYLVDNDPNLWYLSNGYYNDKYGSIPWSIRSFVRATEVASGSMVTVRSRISNHGKLPLYINEDGILCWPHNIPAPSRDVLEHINYQSDTCIICHCEEVDDAHSICDCCLGGDDRKHCFYCGTVLSPLEETTGYCDCCDEYMCDECFDRDHIRCDICRFAICSRDNATYHGTTVYCENCEERLRQAAMDF